MMVNVKAVPESQMTDPGQPVVSLTSFVFIRDL